MSAYINHRLYNHIHTLFGLLLGISLLLANVAFAQDEPSPTGDTIGSRLQMGTLITGTINDNNPRRAYFFEGTRGEVVRLRLTTTAGTLDPLLSVFDNTGKMLVNQDDSNGELGAQARLTLPDDGRYYVVVARWGQALGTTQGDFSLEIERLGTTSREGSTLRYGVPVTNIITSTQPQIFYTFRAEEGDILDVDMVRSSGTLDPFVQIVDRNRFVIAQNDDLTPETRNAGVRSLLIEEAGTYIIIASRYGEASGDTAGSFVLTIGEASNSGLGNSQLAPATLIANQTTEGTLGDNQPLRYYTFEALRDDLITITLDRVDGNLDPYLEIANAGLQVVAENDDGGAGRNARIERFRVPATGLYYVIARRFDGDAGDSAGAYRLQMVRNGNAFDGVEPDIPRLLYGTTVQDAITEDDTDSLYAFWGTIGEKPRISMNRAGGDLDAVLELLDDDQVRILRDDDGGTGNNALIADYSLPYTGIYYIRATRYEGSQSNSSTTGAFNLIFSRDLPQ
jgi:hypothetical protein